MRWMGEWMHGRLGKGIGQRRRAMGWVQLSVGYPSPTSHAFGSLSHPATLSITDLASSNNTLTHPSYPTPHRRDVCLHLDRPRQVHPGLPGGVLHGRPRQPHMHRLALQGERHGGPAAGPATGVGRLDDAGTLAEGGDLSGRGDSKAVGTLAEGGHLDGSRGEAGLWGWEWNGRVTHAWLEGKAWQREWRSCGVHMRTALTSALRVAKPFQTHSQDRSTKRCVCVSQCKPKPSPPWMSLSSSALQSPLPHHPPLVLDVRHGTHPHPPSRPPHPHHPQPPHCC